MQLEIGVNAAEVLSSARASPSVAGAESASNPKLGATNPNGFVQRASITSIGIEREVGEMTSCSIDPSMLLVFNPSAAKANLASPGACPEVGPFVRLPVNRR